MTDTLFADVSEFQAAVNDRYPYPVLSIRVSDGTYRDHKFAQNYAWMKQALDDGRLKLGIVYTYVRPNWTDNYNTVIDMFNQNGGLHPKVAIMLDVEQGGNPAGDGSDWINKLYWAFARWCGDARRIFGYANYQDFNMNPQNPGLWRIKPDGLRVIGAGYGQNPNLPGQIAHQYTDGQGFGHGLPEGAPPFGNCDMNAANGLDPYQLAAACGIGTSEGEDMTGEEHDKLLQVWGALFNPVQSKSKYRKDGEGAIYAVKDFVVNNDAMSHEALIERNALLGNSDCIALVKREADKGDTWAKLVYDKCPK